ncbi:UNVERIFIED_CONTAM: hypothetical protein RMT77_009543 [Armadillidium vulgare]
MLLEIILIVLLFFTIFKITKKPSDYPPGLWGLPLIGYLPLSTESFDKNIEELKKKYGKIFCWKIGSQLLIFLNDYQTIKETFQKVEYADRPRISMVTLLVDEFELGLIATNGTHWHDVRRFTLRHLRDLGMGKSKMVSAVQFEASELVESMKKDAGKSKPLTTDIKIAVINVLWQMVASKRYKFDDKMVLEFDDLMNKLQNNFGYLMLVDIFPWLRTILPKSIYDTFTRKIHHNNISELMLKTFQEYVDEHQKNLDENNPRDFIDDYLLEIERQKSNPDSTMSIRDLLGCTADLFGAGYQTTATAICWSIYYMSKFPETQRKLQKEIDEVLTNKRQASLEDKPRLPYTEAFINETLRYASQTQFHLPRTVTKDTKLLGYTIPKDSLIFPAAEAVHYDRSHFDSPKEFRPERFLNSNGRFEFPKSGYFPFGTGKRQCIGESLARMELLIFITTLVQRLQFSIPNGETLNISPQDIPLFNMPRFDQNILIKVRN